MVERPAGKWLSRELEVAESGGAPELSLTSLHACRYDGARSRAAWICRTWNEEALPGGGRGGVRMAKDKKRAAHILIVDDDQALRELLRLLLRREGYAVAEADDGERALEILRGATARMVVLLDLRMPRLGGDAVLETVEAEDHALSEHAYVLVTANSLGITPRFAALLQRLAVPVVAKPFEVKKLLRTVEQAAARLPAAS